ncbi:glutamine synthetase family protein [Roseovarius sp. SCSIO 43702]|uniref:glutamine synthetase family protein n=1 Tax=Roseovarius sp. SCSIO 43702 TaxID=2823043 RepID=UPI001C72BA70|nr:glutamine synthetase family protein [Roseovarius sp. SCSIO 43702]QYX55751.1 glutamine synthetase family protein [Roseovarius sp. SCSIO 43702]
MIRDPLIFAATSDLAGKMRGKAFPASQLEKRLERGIGWVPTNALITCFDTIAESPFGSLGDLAIMPDRDASYEIDFEDGTPPERFILGDITTPEGAPWLGCTRGALRSALDRLHRVTGLTLNAAFEHEFQLRTDTPAMGEAFTLQGLSRRRAMGEALVAAMAQAGLGEDTFLKEYGAEQFEVTVKPAPGLASADIAAVLRELIHFTARRHGEKATLSPILDPAGVGNGVHIHMSFLDESGAPATHDGNGPCGMTEITGQFIAGILAHLDAIIAFAAPSAISYTRLTPHRWSAAFNNLGFRDREAAVRICPVQGTDPASIARQYNFEFRAADATASPHLVLAAVVHAGCQGIEDALPMPEATEEDLSLLSENALAERGLGALPSDLATALDRLEASDTVRGWFADGLVDVYLAHKRGELDHAMSLDEEARLAAYATVY